MKKIIEYLKLVIIYHQKSVLSAILFYLLAIALCILMMSTAEKLEFWQFWLGYDNKFPLTIISLKLLVISFLCLLIDTLDIRNYNMSFYYYVLSRYSVRKKLDNKIDGILLLIFSFAFLSCYSVIIGYLLIYNVPLSTTVFHYIMIEWMSIASIILVYKSFSIKSGSIFVILFSLINMLLPIKLPLFTSLVSVEQLYDVGLYLVILMSIIYYQFGGKRV